jgi:hypothetical protein
MTPFFIMSTLTIEQVFSHRKWIYEQQTGELTHPCTVNATPASAGRRGAK